MFHIHIFSKNRTIGRFVNTLQRRKTFFHAFFLLPPLQHACVYRRCLQHVFLFVAVVWKGNESNTSFLSENALHTVCAVVQQHRYTSISRTHAQHLLSTPNIHFGITSKCAERYFSHTLLSRIASILAEPFFHKSAITPRTRKMLPAEARVVLPCIL